LPVFLRFGSAAAALGGLHGYALRTSLAHAMKTPVMMIHGMSCTGEVWSQFRTFFEDRGVRVYTPTIYPELRTTILKRPVSAIRDLGFDDYVNFLEQEIQRIELQTGVTPAVIGHSMGGILAQALAERNRVSAAAFISPSPPLGCAPPLMRAFWSVYSLTHKFGYAPKIIRADKFSTGRVVFNRMPAAEHAAALSAMVYESGRAFHELGGRVIDETKIRIPVLTVAASGDRLVPATSVRLTGRKYAAIGGEFREYKNHGHWLYAEPGWQVPAGDILDWLRNATQRAEVASDAPRGTQAANADPQALPGA
jgi:pimeloyl-ACP methyl ester carboxylesterase